MIKQVRVVNSYQLALQAIAELAAEAEPARSPGPELEPEPTDTAP